MNVFLSVKCPHCSAGIYTPCQEIRRNETGRPINRAPMSRYEVAAYGPKNPATTGRREIRPTRNFRTELAAIRHAVELAAEIPTDSVALVTFHCPQSARYPSGPWISGLVRQLAGTLEQPEATS